MMTCIDLFCGCGGLSLGMERAGFRTLAAIDADPKAVAVYRQNFPKVPCVLERDLINFGPEKLAALIKPQSVDVIAGGPPCQGFSTVRKRDGANHGHRLVEDPRRKLYQPFLKYVEFFRPKVFVMENVLGIKSAAGGEYFMRVQSEARALGYRVHGQVITASDYGVPQKRQRQFIFGTRLDLLEFFHEGYIPATHKNRNVTLGEAIGDLPVLRAGGGAEEMNYDMERRRAQVKKYGRHFLYKVLEVQKARRLTAHFARPHLQRDLRDFKRLREGENCLHAMQRGVEFEFPYDKTNFKDRYCRQHRKCLCSTIVAHLNKDGLMFIHPTQNRSLTPREAARVQTFPDWFEFPATRSHQFRLIGNAVPPLVGEAVGLAVKSYLEKAMQKNKVINFWLEPLPIDHFQATEWLMVLVGAADSRNLHRLPDEKFKRGWYSIGFLYPGLHPDGTLERGTEISYDKKDGFGIEYIEPRLINPYYIQSGWPVVLDPVAKEARRRFKRGELADDEYYCTEAAIAGMCYLFPELVEEVKRERAKTSLE